MVNALHIRHAAEAHRNATFRLEGRRLYQYSGGGEERERHQLGFEDPFGSYWHHMGRNHDEPRLHDIARHRHRYGDTAYDMDGRESGGSARHHPDEERRHDGDGFAHAESSCTTVSR